MALRDSFSCLLKIAHDIWYPIFLGYSFQVHQLSELKERTVRLVENIFHHVHLAAVETIGGMVLQLPFSPQHSFKVLPFWQVGELLKLIDADDNLDAFSLGYPFGELQNVFRTFLYRIHL